MAKYSVNIGHGTMTWDSAYNFVPPTPHGKSIGDAFGSIDAALDSPVGSPRLEELAAAADKITIVVPDVTRGWSQAPKMNAAVRARIASVTRKPVSWIVGVGQHRMVTESDLPMVFGDSMMPGDTWVSHDCDKAVDIGKVTPSGVPVALNPAFVDADLIVLVGGITYHLMAGYSGGRKMIMPGASGRRSIIANHNHSIVGSGLNPLTANGIVEGNPMSDDQRAYADLALEGKKCFILNTVSNDQGKPAAWVAGDIWKAWEVGCRTCYSYNTLFIPELASRVVTCCGGFPLDLDLYQSSKAAFACGAALKPGAPLVLVAGLEDGLGPGDYEDKLRWCLRDREGYARHVSEHFTVPAYMALRLAAELSRRPTALVTPRDGVPFPGKVFKTMEEADKWLTEVSGTEGLSVLVPSGNAIYLEVEK